MLFVLIVLSIDSYPFVQFFIVRANELILSSWSLDDKDSTPPTKQQKRFFLDGGDDDRRIVARRSSLREKNLFQYFRF